MIKVLLIAKGMNSNSQINGLSIRSFNILTQLKKNKRYNCTFLNTDNFKHSFFLYFNIFLKSLKNDFIISNIEDFKTRNIIIFLSKIKDIFKKNICHCAEGAYLYKNLINNNSMIDACTKIDIIFCESKFLISKLSELGIHNTKQMYNFKKVKRIENFYKPEIKYCIFSRITEKKGINDAIDVINDINKKGKEKVILDIYGSVNEQYKTKFFSLIKDNRFISYKGIIKHTNSTDIIKKYFMLIFPTKYYFEGIPGTIIDSLSSGVPVIASNWSACKEFINDKTGLIYEFDNKEDLKQKILYSLNNKSKILKMRNNCLKESQKFIPSKAVMPLLKYINNNERVK